MIKEQTAKVKGIHLFEIANANSEKAQKLQAKINQVGIKRQILLSKGDVSERELLDLHNEYCYYKNLLHKEFKVREFLKHNITTTVGRSVIAQRLAAINTYTGNVTHTALGTSATAATVGDTLLGAEVYRKALSSGTASNNISYLETFFTSSETSGTYQEYGNFIDGTGSANTGQLFNRFTQAVTKSVVETLNVSSQITIADA